MWTDIIKLLHDFIRNNKEEKIEEKKRLSKIFLEISDLLYTVYDKLESDIYPQYSCQVMAELSKGIYDELKGTMPDDRLNVLYNMLLLSSKLEMEYSNRKDPATKPNLLMASAKFKSLSILYY
jgi:hypothetical protein